MNNMATQMKALDDFVTRARGQNANYHDKHTQSLTSLSTTVKSSFNNIGLQFTSTYDRVHDLGNEMRLQTTSLQETNSSLDELLLEPLSGLRNSIERTELHEYLPTGETPQKIQYVYPTNLPRTEGHEQILGTMRGLANEPNYQSPSKAPVMVPVVFNDDSAECDTASLTTLRSSRSSHKSPDIEPVPNTSAGLREIDVNTMNMSTMSVPALIVEDGSLSQVPNFRKSVKGEGKLPAARSAKKSMVSLEGRENTVNLSASLIAQQSTGRRRSPRTA